MKLIENIETTIDYFLDNPLLSKIVLGVTGWTALEPFIEGLKNTENDVLDICKGIAWLVLIVLFVHRMILNNKIKTQELRKIEMANDKEQVEIFTEGKKALEVVHHIKLMTEDEALHELTKEHPHKSKLISDYKVVLDQETKSLKSLIKKYKPKQ